MGRFVLRRLAQSAVVLLGVTLVVFLLLQLVPGDPVRIALGTRYDQATYDALRERSGLDRPLPVQYVDFVGRAVQGDFGRSLRYNVPAMALVAERLPATIVLAFSAVVVSALVGIPLGILAAIRKGSLLDDAVIVFSSFGLAAPTFWIGTMLIVVFAVQWRLFPPSGGGSLDKLVLPTLTLAAGFVAVLARFTRSGMIDVLSRDYITTARAKGLTPRMVLLRHALRNTLIPIVTLLGLELAALLGGAVVTENVFAWPGIGRLLVNAIFRRDYQIVQTIVFLSASLIVMINLLTDLVYAYVDPRIRYR